MARNVEIVASGYAHFASTGDLLADIHAPDFVWDMSQFRGWPEQPTYQGIEGARAFLRTWIGAWDDWEVEVESLEEVGEQVLAILLQRGRSKATGLPIDMRFAMLWSLRDGKETRMTMYADPDEALSTLAGGELRDESVR